MGRKIIVTKELINSLKFDDCINCKYILTKRCGDCGAGENFRERNKIKDTYSFMMNGEN